MEHTLYEKLPQVFTKKTIEISNEFDDIVSFSGSYKNYCVGIVDIVNSTKISASMSGEKIEKYYSTFLNTVGTIVRKHNGVPFKNIGDSLLYYFPETNLLNKTSFTVPLECGIEMIKSRSIINTKMDEYKLPPVSFRISVDYGAVVIAKSINSSYDDIFGPSVNMCAKINSVAPPNGMVIGGDLYQIVKSFPRYHFMSIPSCQIGLKLQYPVYYISDTKNGT